MDSQAPVEEVQDSQEIPATPVSTGGDEGRGDGVPSELKALAASGLLKPAGSMTSLRQWLPEEWRNRFVEGGVADVLIPAATMEHRIATISAQIVAHAALTVMMETIHLEPSSSMWVSIEKAMEVDLLSQKDMHALKALNREANACKHSPISGSGQVGSSSSHNKRSGPY